VIIKPNKKGITSINTPVFTNKKTALSAFYLYSPCYAYRLWTNNERLNKTEIMENE
jgi:hypothetical protein